MKRRITTILLALGVSVNCNSQNLFDKERILHDLDSMRVSFHIPAISFGVANCDSVLLLGDIGVTETGTADSVTINDEFHIGSLGKGFLSFIAGKLVDEGKITWDTKFFDTTSKDASHYICKVHASSRRRHAHIL